MFKKWKLNRDNTKIIVFCYPIQIRNNGIPSNVKLYQTDINFPAKLGNLRVVSDENLKIKYQLASV